MVKGAQQKDGFRFEFPKGFDKTQLRAFSGRIKADFIKEQAGQARQLVRELPDLARVSEIQARMLKMDPRAAEKESREALRKIKNAARDLPPPDLARILKMTGHNPTRFAPYEAAGWYASNGGIFGYESRGPDRATGQTGALLEASTAGHAHIAHDVGVFFFSNVNATLRVTVSAPVWGVAAIYSPLSGYATAFAGLRASISQWSPYDRATAVTTIYNAGNIAAANVWRTPGWAHYNAKVFMPIKPETMYFISGGAIQNVAAAGLLAPYAKSSFFMPVRPITFEVI